MKQSSLKHTFFLSLFASFLLLTLSSCGTRPAPRVFPKMNITASNSSYNKSNNVGYYKVGRPYKIKGRWYRPSSNYSYDQTGIASWYGQRFHNRKTANGEIFNKNELTAAHKTLPLPCLARVTNLENGRSIVVRVNDRGPFSGKRIIDLSQRAAQLLGFERKGIAKVRVQVMKEESKAIADAMRSYGTYSKRRNTNKIRLANVETAKLPPIATYKPKPIVKHVKVTGNNNIYVQAGAFTNLDNAYRLQEKLSNIGKAIIAKALVRNVEYYRVRIGPLSSVSMADHMVDKVVRSGASNEARIVID